LFAGVRGRRTEDPYVREPLYFVVATVLHVPVAGLKSREVVVDPE
jgi:hypothetical protein